LLLAKLTEFGDPDGKTYEIRGAWVNPGETKINRKTVTVPVAEFDTWVKNRKFIEFSNGVAKDLIEWDAYLNSK
jgi:hypothetical protein